MGGWPFTVQLFQLLHLAGLIPALVGVGITVAHDPLHGSRRAELPHRALALGNDAKTRQRIGMTDIRGRQPAADVSPHSLAGNMAALAAALKRAMP